MSNLTAFMLGFGVGVAVTAITGIVVTLLLVG